MFVEAGTPFLKFLFSALIPTQFAWMAAPGIYVGDVKVPATSDDASLPQRSLISNARLISYPDTGKSKHDIVIMLSAYTGR